MGVRKKIHRWIVLAVVLLTALPVYAGVVRQITDVVATDTVESVIDDSGAAVFLVSTDDRYGTNPDNTLQIFRYDTATGEGFQVTSSDLYVYYSSHSRSLSTTDDGATVAFLSQFDPLGTNPDNSLEIFQIDADGSNLRQSTNIIQTTDWVSIVQPVISGSGNRIVFESDDDLLGTNPQQANQIYIIDSDGSDLRQLTFGDSSNYRPSISDDGNRVAYMSYEGTTSNRFQIFRILADGTGGMQLTSWDVTHSYYPRISGDGSTIAFYTEGPVPEGPSFPLGHQVLVVNWDGTGLQWLAAPDACATGQCGVVDPPDITDDGSAVLYTSNHLYTGEVWRVESDGSTPTQQVTDTDRDAYCRTVRVSGDGSTMVFRCEGGAAFGEPNEDLSGEMYFGDATGTGDPEVHHQLTDEFRGDSYQVDLASGGSRIVYLSDVDPFNQPGNNSDNLYTSSPDGSGLTQVTTFEYGDTPEDPSISGDGSLIVFSADGDLFGTGYWGYKIYAVQSDGTGLRQVTASPSSDARVPQISDDGSLIVFRSGYTVKAIRPDGSGLTQLSQSGGGDAESPHVDAGGQYATYLQDNVVYRVRTDGTDRQALSGTGYANWPDISGDGTKVVWQESSDQYEEDSQLYLWEQSTGSSRPLTATAEGTHARPVLSRDGAWVYFWSDAYFGVDFLGWAWRYRMETATGELERTGGLGGCLEEMTHPGSLAWTPSRISVNQDGSLGVTSSTRSCSGNATNYDGSSELFLIDHTAQAKIYVSPGPAPTTISWDAEPRPVYYDVIRGDLDSLTPGGAGVVDLGTVYCVDDDTAQSYTRRNEDPDIPAVGQVFFYLYRGDDIVAGDPGSYGTSSAGDERLPSSGDCE